MRVRAPGGGRGRRAIAAAVAVLALATFAPPTRAQGTSSDDEGTDPLAELATTAPADTPGIDDVLDVVGVEPTRAIERAERDLDEASAVQSTAALALIAAEQERAARAGTVADADRTVADAERTDRRARATLTAAKAELARRRARERLLRAALEVEQDRLRAMAAQLMASVPDDRYLVLSDLDDITEADRRAAARDRGVELQSDAVEAAKRPWERARAARRAQARRTDRASEAADRAVAALRRARDERAHAADRLAEMESLAATRRERLDDATERSTAAIARRRLARLDSDVDVDGAALRLVALHAYWRAAQLAPCRIPWWLLAGVGRIETRHGTAQGSKVDRAGDTSVRIVGIPLDGRPGTAAVADTDGGALDGDAAWDRAVGPMQFLPGTWRVLGRDGDGDGDRDPNNLYDAADAAAGLLCLAGTDLTSDAGRRIALLRYNASIPYGKLVLAEGAAYRDALALPEVPPRPGDVER